MRQFLLWPWLLWLVALSLAHAHILSNPRKRVSVYIPKGLHEQRQRWVSGGHAYMCIRYNQPGVFRPFHGGLRLFMIRSEWWRLVSRRRACPIEMANTLTKLKEIANQFLNNADMLDEQVSPTSSEDSPIELTREPSIPADDMDNDSVPQSSRKARRRKKVFIDNRKNRLEVLDLVYALDCNRHFEQPHVLEQARVPKGKNPLDQMLMVKFRLPEHKGKKPVRYNVILKFEHKWYSALNLGRRLAYVTRAQDEQGDAKLPFVVESSWVPPKPKPTRKPKPAVVRVEELEYDEDGNIIHTNVLQPPRLDTVEEEQQQLAEEEEPETVPLPTGWSRFKDAFRYPFMSDEEKQVYKEDGERLQQQKVGTLEHQKQKKEAQREKKQRSKEESKEKKKREKEEAAARKKAELARKRRRERIQEYNSVIVVDDDEIVLPPPIKW